VAGDAPVEPQLLEIVRVRQGRPELAGEHARRLAAASRAIRFDRCADPDEVESRIASASESSRAPSSMLVVASRGGVSVVHFEERPASSSSFGVDQLARGVPVASIDDDAPFDVADGLRLKRFDVADPERHAAHARVREERQVHELLLVRPEGCVVGGSRANLFLVVDDEWVTPSVESGAFPGILRAATLLAADHLGTPATQRRVTRDDLARASDALLVSSAHGIVSVRAIDGRELEPPAARTRWRRFVPQLRLRVHELARARLLPR
jgi:branched-subunit amino acid aminotransferase/4-amino-4-deoxychorismate lyase